MQNVRNQIDFELVDTPERYQNALIILISNTGISLMKTLSVLKKLRAL